MATFKASFQSKENLNAQFGTVTRIEPGSLIKVNYNTNVFNRPSIEGHELIGNKSFKQLGMDTLSVQEIEKILYFD